MGGSEDGKSISNSKSLEMENLTLDISASNRFSRDLLQRFRGSANEHGADKEEEDNKIELNLGLSMGGRFGVDKSSNKLIRSSSIASCLPESREDNDSSSAAAAAHSGLVRTSSLPVETEEEWRKRKELQTLRRMEAKRRRSEKQRNLKSESGSGGGGSLSVEEKKDIELNLRARLDREKSLSSLKRTGSGLASQFGLPAWAAAASSATPTVHRSGVDAAVAKGKGSYVGFGSQGSVESKGGSSSTVSDLESKNIQGISTFLKNFYLKIKL